MNRTTVNETQELVSTFINLRAQLHESIAEMKLKRDELHQRTDELRVGRQLIHRTAALIHEEIGSRRDGANGATVTGALPMREAVAFVAPALSPRQRSVLEGILAGQANKTIAFDLGVSTKTVETHRARVMQRFGATSFAELVRICCRAAPHLEDPAPFYLDLTGTLPRAR
jgi:DNA-binding NarL/FixJ family response regulator